MIKELIRIKKAECILSMDPSSVSWYRMYKLPPYLSWYWTQSDIDIHSNSWTNTHLANENIVLDNILTKTAGLFAISSDTLPKLIKFMTYINEITQASDLLK